MSNSNTYQPGQALYIRLLAKINNEQFDDCLDIDETTVKLRHLQELEKIRCPSIESC